MTKEEGEEDLFELIYDLPEWFMMTWVELMGMTSTVGCDIWSANVTETTNYPTFTNDKRHFKPQSKNPIPIYWGRHFESQSNDPTSINRGRHFKPQDTDLNDPTKISHITRRGDTSNPHIWRPTTRQKPWTKPPNKHPLKRMRSLSKTQANISLWGLLMASYKHRQNLVDILNQIQVLKTTTSQDLW